MDKATRTISLGGFVSHFNAMLQRMVIQRVLFSIRILDAYTLVTMLPCKLALHLPS